MSNKRKKTHTNNKKNDGTDTIVTGGDEVTEEENIREELDPDIAKALNVKPKKNNTVIEIDYIPETDLTGVGLDEYPEDEI
ncbi:hypothetical protein JXA34_02645 [Patescibacteria group bacterium]|nr:hypothetical protein [Patescibacteria group bacterium]